MLVTRDKLAILPILLLMLSGGSLLQAQTITGAWKGYINRTRVELKLIKSGDSITGTSYYYTGNRHYRRYSVKGYFDPETNDVVYWDDALIEDRAADLRDAAPRLMVANFNCPGEDKMMLDGVAGKDNDKDSPKQNLHLEKTNQSLFADEWDFVLQHYFTGANDPDIIDSIARIHNRQSFPEETPAIVKANPEVHPAETKKIIKEEKRSPPVVTAAPSNLDKFSTRTKKLQTVIPLKGDKIELRFYDNAQVDGDSIALFLNGKLLLEHIYLTEKAYVVEISADELQDDNELVMVAENLGSIPPNTSYMVAEAGGKRYEARLFADEKSSALIRIIRNKTD